jgi:hypothetical protein
VIPTRAGDQRSPAAGESDLLAKLDRLDNRLRAIVATRRGSTEFVVGARKVVTICSEKEAGAKRKSFSAGASRYRRPGHRSIPGGHAMMTCEANTKCSPPPEAVEIVKIEVAGGLITFACPQGADGWRFRDTMLALFDRFPWRDVNAMRVHPDCRQSILMKIAMRLDDEYGDEYTNFEWWRRALR